MASFKIGYLEALNIIPGPQLIKLSKCRAQCDKINEIFFVKLGPIL